MKPRRTRLTPPPSVRKKNDFKINQKLFNDSKCFVVYVQVIRCVDANEIEDSQVCFSFCDENFYFKGTVQWVFLGSGFLHKSNTVWPLINGLKYFFRLGLILLIYCTSMLSVQKLTSLCVAHWEVNQKLLPRKFKNIQNVGI